MPSQFHEVLVAMVRGSEAMARTIRTRDQSYSETQPPEYRADLAVEFVLNGSDTPTRMRTHDSYKRRTWSASRRVRASARAGVALCGA